MGFMRIDCPKLLTIQEIQVKHFTFSHMNYVILASGWVVYFLLHSLLAAKRVKALVKPGMGRYYRLIYSVFATGGLVALLIFNGSFESPGFFESAGLVRYLSLVLTTFGVMTMQLAFRQYRLKSFLGFAEEKDELKIEGILKNVRHPIYSGLILVTTGFFLFIPNIATLVSCVCILLYLPVGIYLEERKLIAMFGEKYLRYKEQVPSLFPKIFFSRESS
jgi:protein-S-isoprenylcysteine O-methyltransferase Ste14